MGLSFDQNKFSTQFPDGKVSSDNVTYTVEDSDYRVYNPSWKNGELQIQIDHIRGGATDDHVYLSLAFNASDASLSSISGSWKAGNDGYTIPKIVVTAVDVTAAVLGAAGALETAGISEAAAAAAVAAFDGFCKLFNKLSPLIVGLSDDGGRFYTIAVTCHTLSRACASVSVK